MPHTDSTVRTLTHDLVLGQDESAEQAMHRVDQAEVDAVCRHLLGDLVGDWRVARRRPAGAPR